MTFEEMCSDIATIITQYEQESKKIIGCYIETERFENVKIYEFNGQEFNHRKNIKVQCFKNNDEE